MYDTSPLAPFKGEAKHFLHVDFDNKTLESLFDLHPSLENSLDLTEFVSSAISRESAATSPPGVPDSSVVTSPVASSAADLLTLSSAATSQHLAEIERLPASITTTTTTTYYPNQQTSPGPVVPSLPSPVTQYQPVAPPPPLPRGCKPSLSPSLSVDDVSQALSDDSCAFMPEYEQLTISTVPSRSSGHGNGGTAGGVSPWGQDSYYSTVKTEDLGLSTLTACSLEASLPGFASTTNTISAANLVKMESSADGPGASCPGRRYSGGAGVSPSRSMRTLSESSTATTSTMPDSPGRSSSSKAGSKRRQVPKGSEEYKEKRARNNVAVRKSRAKAKEKQKMTEGRVKELMDQNDALTKKVEMLTKELTVLRGLFVNVGASLPDDFSNIMEQS